MRGSAQRQLYTIATPNQNYFSFTSNILYSKVSFLCKIHNIAKNITRECEYTTFDS